MSQWQDQIQANANAIALMLSDAKAIKDHAALAVAISDTDKILIQLASDDSTVYATRTQLVGTTFNPTITTAALGDIIVYNGFNWVNLGAGTDGQILSSASLESTGLKWIADSGSQNLQAVTDTGNTTTNSIRVAKLEIDGANSWLDIVATELTLQHNGQIDLINSTDGSRIEIRTGNVSLSSDGTQFANLQTDLLTADRTYDFANTSGTIPMTVNGVFPDAFGNITIATASMPLTTKGDLFTYSTVAERLAIGANGLVLTADSGEATGLKWTTAGAGDMVSAIYDPASISEQLVGLTATQSLTNKTLKSFTNFIHADVIHKELRNESGGAIVKGDVVYISGYSVGSELALVSLADSSASGTMPGFAICADATIANNANGDFITVGTLNGINTSMWSVGDPIYVSNVGTTGNTLTNTNPTGTDKIQKIAKVLRSHATLGVIEIFGAGRSNDLPNLAEDNIWVGNASGVPIETLYTPFSGFSTVSADYTGITALDSEINLLDLAGLTAGWVLSADTATTASWKAPSGGGNVSKVGTPVDNQIGVWTGDGTIEGDTGLTWNGTTFDVGGDITVFGTVDGIDIATDVGANTAKITNATHTGDVTGATVLTIANDVVTNAKAANVATSTFKGRKTATTGDPEDLTITQSKQLLDDRILENATTITTQELDYAAYDIFNFTVTGAVTFTESNLPTSGTNGKVILINITGNFALTYPANWSTNIRGTYDGTTQNVIAVWYVKSGVYIVDISQKD